MDPRIREFLDILSKWCVAEPRLVMEFSGIREEESNFRRAYRNANKPPRGWNFENRIRVAVRSNQIYPRDRLRSCYYDLSITWMVQIGNIPGVKR